MGSSGCRRRRSGYFRSDHISSSIPDFTCYRQGPRSPPSWTWSSQAHTKRQHLLLPQVQLFLTLPNHNWLLRYKDRTERRRWLGCLLQQTSIRPKNIAPYPSFLSSKPYKEPALQVRTKRSASQMSSANSTTDMSTSDYSVVSRNESELIAQDKIQRSMKRRRSAISVLAKIPKAIKKRLSIAWTLCLYFSAFIFVL